MTRATRGSTCGVWRATGASPSRPRRPPSARPSTAHFELRRQNLSPKHAQHWLATMETYVFPHIGDIPVARHPQPRPGGAQGPMVREARDRQARAAAHGCVFKAAILRGWRKEASPTLGVSQELGTRRTRRRAPQGAALREMPASSDAADMQLGADDEARLRVSGPDGDARMRREAHAGRRSTKRRRGRSRGAPHEAAPTAHGAVEPALPGDPGGGKALGPEPADLPQRRPARPFRDGVHGGAARQWLGSRATPHGFRSSFRDWCSETGEREVVGEAALAHVVRGVEGAYRRSTYIQERRGLMQRWANHCEPG